MRIHEQHLKRHLNATLSLHSLGPLDLQGYVERCSREKGLHGRKLSPATIKKNLITLRTAWNWAVYMGHLARPFPNRGLRFGKITEKQPFQTVAEIAKQIARGGISEAEEADLWDSAFLTQVREFGPNLREYGLRNARKCNRDGRGSCRTLCSEDLGA